MKKETRVYVVEIALANDTEYCLNPQVDNVFNETKFIELAEEQGTVYTLSGFQSAVNDWDIDLSKCNIYIKEVEYHE